MKKILFCGGCDVTAISRYIKKSSNVEIIDFNSTRTWMNSISFYWVQSLANKKLDNYQKYQIYYPDEKLFHNSNIDILVLSILGEVGEGLYRYKENGCYLLYGPANVDATKNYSFFTNGGGVPKNSVLESVVNDFEYLGEINFDDVVNNYKKILSNLKTSTKVYIILGPTFESTLGESNSYFRSINGSEKYKLLNKKIIEGLKDYKNVSFINPLRFYHKPKKIKQLYYYNYPSIRHYPRSTYLGMAMYLTRKHISLRLSLKEILKYIIRSLSK